MVACFGVDLVSLRFGRIYSTLTVYSSLVRRFRRIERKELHEISFRMRKWLITENVDVVNFWTTAVQHLLLATRGD